MTRTHRPTRRNSHQTTKKRIIESRYCCAIHEQHQDSFHNVASHVTDTHRIVEDPLIRKKICPWTPKICSGFRDDVLLIQRRPVAGGRMKSVVGGCGGGANDDAG